MKLQDIKPLSEAMRHEDPKFSYNNEMEPRIENIQGSPYSMYVNEVDKKMPYSITFLIASDDDDGVSWEVDLGEPTATSIDYEAPHIQQQLQHFPINSRWVQNVTDMFKDVLDHLNYLQR